MSVMSVGKKPKALVRSLGAGNSRAGAHRGESRAGEPGAAASRSGKRSLPGVLGGSAAGSRGGPAAGGRQEPPARPRLWVVPDVAVPDVAGPDVAVPNAAAPNVAGPKVVVPRPRVAADGQIPARLPSTRPAGAPSRTRWSAPHRCRPGCLSSASGGPGLPGAGAGWSGLSRFSSSSRCSPRSCSLWRPGAGGQSWPAAVCGAGQHAARRGQARPVPVVDRVERRASG